MSTTTFHQKSPATASRLYRSVWRWHFFAGLFVVPVLIIMAFTGLVMLYGNSVETMFGPRYSTSRDGIRASLVDQARAATATIPGGTLKLVVVPATDSQATIAVVDAGGSNINVSVDPHGPTVLGSVVKDTTWYYWANSIHGTLMMGTFGDRLVEVVAGLGLILVLTGLYMWWPRNARTVVRALIPDLRTKGRLLWKELHLSVGLYVSLVLVFFLISGLTWTGIWGERIVQAFSTFPAAKWDNVPLSDKTHASMNHGVTKEVPWALEQTPMPKSGSHSGHDGVREGMPVDLDSIAALARQIGFDGQFRINAPQEEAGVFTVSADSMDGDTSNATGDRTVHIDRYTGKILADVGFSDYSLAGKAMAVGIALHQGNLGPLNTALNVLFCVSVLFICFSGIVMWWKRRPVGRVSAPRYPRDFRAPAGILAIGVAVCVAFPLTGVAVALFAMVDYLLPSRLKEMDAGSPAA